MILSSDPKVANNFVINQSMEEMKTV